jgi:hypothetical protein
MKRLLRLLHGVGVPVSYPVNFAWMGHSGN